MVVIDETDGSIIDVIRHNAKLSTHQIAKKIGISVATVNRRLKKMHKNKIIKEYATIFDEEKLGKKTVGFILIITKPGANYNDVMDAARKHEVVKDIYATAGQFDIILKVQVKDNEELGDFIFNYVRNFPSVARTETLMALPVKKRKKK